MENLLKMGTVNKSETEAQEKPREKPSTKNRPEEVPASAGIGTTSKEAPEEKKTDQGFSKKPENVSASAGKKPINWQEVLANINPNDRCTETAATLRMIADMEDIPPPEVTSNIDFRQVYHQMANAMEGKPIVADARVTAVLQLCVRETAIRSQGLITPELREFIRILNTAANTIEKPPHHGPTDNPDLAALRDLISKPNYNPLNVPEEFLTFNLPKEEKE